MYKHDNVFSCQFSIFRVFDEAKRQKPILPTEEEANRLYDRNSLFEKLASLVDKPQTDIFDTDAYSVSFHPVINVD